MSENVQKEREIIERSLKKILDIGEDVAINISFHRIATQERQTSPELPWIIDLNQQYQKVISLVISLSTGALILPVFFLRQFLAVKENKSIIDYVSEPSLLCMGLVYWSWILLSLAIASGILFNYVSATRLKEAWGRSDNTLFFKQIKGEKTVQKWLFIFFDLCVICFLGGLLAFVVFSYKAIIGP